MVETDLTSCFLPWFNESNSFQNKEKEKGKNVISQSVQFSKHRWPTPEIENCNCIIVSDAASVDYLQLRSICI